MHEHDRRLGFGVGLLDCRVHGKPPPGWRLRRTLCCTPCFPCISAPILWGGYLPEDINGNADPPSLGSAARSKASAMRARPSFRAYLYKSQMIFFLPCMPLTCSVTR